MVVARRRGGRRDGRGGELRTGGQPLVKERQVERSVRRAGGRTEAEAALHGGEVASGRHSAADATAAVAPPLLHGRPHPGALRPPC